MLRTCVFTNRTWTTQLSVTATTRIRAQTTRSQPVAHRFLLSVSEILGRCSFVCQRTVCREPSLSGPPSPFPAPNFDPESIVDVCSGSTEEEKSCGSGCYWPSCGRSGLLDQSHGRFWNDKLASWQRACADLSLGGSVRSAFVGSEGLADTNDDDGLGEKCRKESVG